MKESLTLGLTLYYFGRLEFCNWLLWEKSLCEGSFTVLDVNAVHVVSLSPWVFALQWSLVCINSQPFWAVPPSRSDCASAAEAGWQRLLMPQNAGSLRWHLPGCSSHASQDLGHVLGMVLLLPGTEHEGFSWSSDRIEDFVVTSRVKHRHVAAFASWFRCLSSQLSYLEYFSWF